jgi:hypothetical protein
MYHQQIGNSLLPDFLAGDILLPIGNQPSGSSQDQDRESCIDRKPE